jgi:5-methylcytosine-specific restriction protein B
MRKLACLANLRRPQWLMKRVSSAAMTPDEATQWRASLAEMRSNLAFRDKRRAIEEERRSVQPELTAFFTAFRDGTLSMQAFSEAFGHGAASQWRSFGLNGASGTLFLRKLVNHAPERGEAVGGELRSALQTPSTEEQARERLRAIYDRLNALIASAQITDASVHPKRIVSFVSYVWHVDQPDSWPAYFTSMRKSLPGVATVSEDPVDGYISFLHAVRAARGALDISTWELEHLCLWRSGEADTEATSVPPPQDQGRIWLFNPTAPLWPMFRDKGILGADCELKRDLREFASDDAIWDTLIAQRGDGAQEPRHETRLCWELSHVIRPGDEVFVRGSATEVIGHGTVTSEYQYVPNGSPAHVVGVKWLWHGAAPIHDRRLVSKTLTDITDYDKQVDSLRRAVGLRPPRSVAPLGEPGAVGGDEDHDIIERDGATYTIEDAKRDLFRTHEEVEQLQRLLLHRKNIILAGPPGVGKTFVARRLAYLVAGAQDDSLVRFVQFHQSVAYEDFVQGYRPTASGGFERREGPFLQFCTRAAETPGQPHVLVIDEINRGNLSKIFGELLMLIEADKRSPQWKVQLAYGLESERFFVPPNVHIIGTMNTADRSLAMIDYALRRRFAYCELDPKLHDSGFEQWLLACGAPSFIVSRLRDRIGRLNETIRADPQLGVGYLIGHSYFTPAGRGERLDEAWYERIVEYELSPLLREYWFDNPERAREAKIALLRDD